MLDQTFTRKTLARHIRRSDPRRFQISGGRSAIEARLKYLETSISNRNFTFKHIVTKPAGKSEIVSSKDFGENLALRKLDDHIRRVYKLRQENREEVTKQLFHLLRESSPKHIIRTDIKSFYESIDTRDIFSNVESNPILSLTSKHIFAQWKRDAVGNRSGLPRGFGISASLSELYMQSIDRRVRAIRGVYFYARYVDDIIIFSYREPLYVLSDLERILASTPLELQYEKTETNTIGACVCLDGCKCSSHKKKCECDNGKSCKCSKQFDDYAKDVKFPGNDRTAPRVGFTYIDYLGYRFYSQEVNRKEPNKPNTAYISISDQKIKKLKSRIAKTFNKYAEEKNEQLLQDRLKFLTGSVPIRSQKGRLLSGVPYSYRTIHFSYGRPAFDPDALDELDRFIRNCLFNEKWRPGRYARKSLPKRDREKLARLSFKKSFHCHIVHKFNESRIKEIQKAWIDEQN